jgi:hypothetical protein
MTIKITIFAVLYDVTPYNLVDYRCTASIFRVEEQHKYATREKQEISYSLLMEMVCFSETSVYVSCTTRHWKLEGGTSRSDRCESLKSN